MLSETENQLLADSLRQLAATGNEGFEGLIQRLLSRLTGFEFYLAQSGTQSGRDMSCERGAPTVIAVECKRFGADTALREDELKGKLVSAVDAIPELDLWVLATSRPVHDQLYSGLQNAGSLLDVDVCVLSLDGAQSGSLATLCANAPDLVAEALDAAARESSASVRRLLEDVRRRADFSRARDALRDTLNKGAGLHAARFRLNRALRASFSSESQSRSSFGQRVDIDVQQGLGRLVERRSSAARLDEWLRTWPASHAGLAWLGQEGGGKTWAVAAWISRWITPTSGPLVLWIPSREASVNDLEALLGGCLGRRLGESAERWLVRLRRWSSFRLSEHPVLVLVLDGINERHRPLWWRPIIEGLAAEPWHRAIAPIVTTRTSYWPQVAGFSHIAWHQCELSGYDDRELETALMQRGLTREDLPREILPLVRKPRYLDLAVKHRDAMAASGDITEARLIYEDWRDRESRRAGLATETEFQQAIMVLAERQRSGQKLTRADLSDASIGIDYDALLGELHSSGMLVPEGTHWRVEPSRLALGLGLLLVDRLLSEHTSRDVVDVLESSLEPSPDIEFKATIVEHAVIHALRWPACPTDIRSLLIGRWLAMRNQDERIGGRASAYFSLDPVAFLAAAEFVWSDAVDDAWAEEMLKGTFQRFASMEAAQPHLVQAFERWLGFLLDHNEAAGQDAGRKSGQAELSEAIGREIAPGSLEYAGTRLTVVSDPGLLRLSRLALAVISCTDRRPYAHALATTFLADALTERSNLADVCRWVIRSAHSDLSSLLGPEARRFIDAGSTAARQAAYRLLTSVGTAEALKLRESLGPDVFPRSALLDRYMDDPCMSGLAWRLEDCARCAGNDSVPSRHMAQQLAKCVLDPTFSIPSNTVSRLVALAQSVDVAKAWSSIGRTEHDLAFDTIEAVLASCAPSQLADVVRALAREVVNRRDLALRQIAFRLRHFRLALTDVEMESIRRVWESLRQLAPDEDEEPTRAEHALFDLLLTATTSTEQLDALLARHSDALLYTSFGDHFKPTSWEQISARLLDAADDRDRACILAFAGAHPETVPDAASEQLVPLLDRPDPLVRFLVLKLIFQGGVASAGAAVAKGKWRAAGRDGAAVMEDHWGSLVLAKWGGDIPYEELRERINPLYLGLAVSARGFREHEITQFAADLDDAWQHCGVEPESSYPRIEVSSRASESSDMDFDLGLPRVPSSEFSRTISFRDRNSTWGGRSGAPPRKNLLSGPSDAEIQSMHTRLGEVLSEQRRAGNDWFAQRFSTVGLKEVVAARPDLIDRWLGKPKGPASLGAQAWLARSFYEALCQVLLSVRAISGVELYKWLRKADCPVRFVDHETGIPVLDFALFSATYSSEVATLWDEYLEAASCDRDLLVVAALASDGAAASWLSERLERDVRSERPLTKIRAIRLDGFSGAPSLASSSTSSASDVIEWQQEQQERAKKNRRSGEWARQWFERFVAADSDDDALGAFRMFLKCVDSRYAWWRGIASAALPAHRARFLASEVDDIERAVRKNEDALRKEFLGMRVAERQVWPWL